MMNMNIKVLSLIYLVYVLISKGGHGIPEDLPGKEDSLERHTQKLLRKVGLRHWSNGIKQVATMHGDTAHQTKIPTVEMSEKDGILFSVMACSFLIWDLL